MRNKKGHAFAFWHNNVFIVFASIIFLCLPGIGCGQNTIGANQYTFKLNRPATTSAGVYRPTDSTLVRTLWSVKHYSEGTHRIEWDGKNDLGYPMPPGNYTVKVVSNNVKYTWEGIVGNTSDRQTGSTVHRGYIYCMGGMTIANGTAYYCTGYSEGSPSVAKFLTSKPQQKIDIERWNVTTANTDIVANDGKTVYWAGYDAYVPSDTFVWGTKVSDDSYVTFPGGVNFKQKQKYAIGYNTIGYVHQVNSLITGLAVQKSGKLLFVARAGLNQLAVLDKGTGKLLQTISINDPGKLCVDMNDNLWMVSDTNHAASVSKYHVNANGTLSAPVLRISSVLKPIALAVSPDNSTIAIADGGISSQQVKAFSNSTGSPLWTLGTPGGYMHDAAVNNNKFYFNDVRGRMTKGGEDGFLAFIAFQPDGSFWVNDPGNFRAQHYSAKRTFIETIMAMGASYSTWADKNDNTRVGAEYLEFKIDNSKPLSGKTGWRLVKNWGANISSSYDKTAKFMSVVTLTSKGVSRKYGFLRIGAIYHLVEFQSNNSLRFTGISMTHCNIDKDGSILRDDFTRLDFLGFDNSNDPIWSKTPVTLATTLTLQDRGPLPKEWVKNTYVTSTGKVIFYDYGINVTANYNNIYNTGFHLGAIQQGGSSWLWETALATNRDYIGPFPDPGYFDIGNHVNAYAGSSAMVLNRNIITGYHGEFWKGSQANMYNHYLDNGLAIGQFGTAGPKTSLAPPMMAGNALSPQLVYGGNNDEMYLWHGDESYHSGIHKWRISGLNTISEQDIPITYPSAALVPSPVPGINLMANLPRNTTLVNDTAGWTFNPPTIPTASPGKESWSIKTNALVYGVQNNPDIYIKCNASSGNFSLNRDLGNNTGLTYWKVTGEISYYLTDQQGGMKQYMDILDDKGKIIARISNKFVFVSNLLGTSTNTIYGNNQVLVTGFSHSVIEPIMHQFQPVEISANNKSIIIKYAGYTVTAPAYDPTADISSPKTLRANITGGPGPTGRNFDFKDMRFITTKTN